MLSTHERWSSLLEATLTQVLVHVYIVAICAAGCTALIAVLGIAWTEALSAPVVWIGAACVLFGAEFGTMPAQWFFRTVVRAALYGRSAAGCQRCRERQSEVGPTCSADAS